MCLCVSVCVFVSGEDMTSWFWHVGFQKSVKILGGDAK